MEVSSKILWSRSNKKWKVMRNEIGTCVRARSELKKSHFTNSNQSPINIYRILIKPPMLCYGLYAYMNIYAHRHTFIQQMLCANNWGWTGTCGHKCTVCNIWLMCTYLYFRTRAQTWSDK